jgi:hypothetical protein
LAALCHRRAIEQFTQTRGRGNVEANKPNTIASNLQRHMKKLVLTFVAAGTLLNAQAQLFGPEAWGGAFWGGIIGGIGGGDHYGHYRHGYYHHHSGFSGEGAAIGAGVGLLAGALAGEARRHDYYAGQPYYSYTEPVYEPPYAYYAPNSYCAPGNYYQPSRPNYAVGGTLLGAASGALIGAASDQPGEGAAIGAAAGLVLGGIAEHATRKQERKVATVQAPPAPQPAPQSPSSEVESPRLSESQVTSKPGPTSTYYWTDPPPQIPDAPRVPDAPTF